MTLAEAADRAEARVEPPGQGGLRGRQAHGRLADQVRAQRSYRLRSPPAWHGRTTIDRAGRVLIPAPIRERAGFKPGTELEVVVDDISVWLIRRVPPPKLVRVGKRLVARPSVPASKLPSVDLATFVTEERNHWPW